MTEQNRPTIDVILETVMKEIGDPLPLHQVDLNHNTWLFSQAFDLFSGYEDVEATEIRDRIIEMSKPQSELDALFDEMTILFTVSVYKADHQIIIVVLQVNELETS